MKERTNTAKWLEKQGRWQIAVQKDGVRKTFTSSRPGREGQREANRKADEWLSSGISGTKLRLSELHESYMEQLKTHTTISNWRPVDARWRKWIDPQIGHMKASALSDAVLQRVVDHAYQEGRLSKKTLNNIKADLTSFCKYLRKAKVSNYTPEDIAIPKSARASRKNILQPEHVIKLFAEDTTTLYNKRIVDPLVNAYRLEVLTGLRPGELRGLMRNDIDLETGKIIVRRSINEYDEITTGKNENAVRAVFVGEMGKEVLKNQLAQSNGLYLFDVKRGEHYRRSWKRYCEANDIPQTTPYELRHTFVSMAQALPEGWVKQLVGHSKSMDTFGVYGHAVAGMEKQITSALDDVFGGILATQE